MSFILARVYFFCARMQARLCDKLANKFYLSKRPQYLHFESDFKFNKSNLLKYIFSFFFIEPDGLSNFQHKLKYTQKFLRSSVLYVSITSLVLSVIFAPLFEKKRMSKLLFLMPKRITKYMSFLICPPLT